MTRERERKGEAVYILYVYDRTRERESVSGVRVSFCFPVIVKRRWITRLKQRSEKITKRSEGKRLSKSQCDMYVIHTYIYICTEILWRLIIRVLKTNGKFSVARVRERFDDVEFKRRMRSVPYDLNAIKIEFARAIINRLKTAVLHSTYVPRFQANPIAVFFVRYRMIYKLLIFKWRPTVLN